MEKGEFYRDARDDLRGPLDGVHVIDATTAWAGPMASCMLADFGADVIRTVIPGDQGLPWPPTLPGTDRSFAEDTVHRNKRSMTIDLRRPEGASLFLDLVQTVDIVVENFKPGTLAGWGVGYEDCRAVKEDIVYLSVSGYGQFGPLSHLPGYDPVALAYSGWMSLNGEADGRPMKAPTFVGDDLAGVHGAMGAMAALHHRDRTGEGQHVDVSLLDSVLFQSNGHLTLGAMGYRTPRWGSQVSVCAPTNSYECTDGNVFLAVALDRHWAALAHAIDRPELAEDPRCRTGDARLDNREFVDGVTASWCREHTTANVVETLGGAGITVARINEFYETAQDPHVLERDMLQPTELADGTVAPLIGPPAKFSRTPTRVRSGAPVPGGDTDAVLHELGVDSERLRELRGMGIV